MGQMLSDDKRTKIYTAIFAASIFLFVISLVFPGGQYDHIDMWLFAPSVIVLTVSATGLSSRIKVIGERIQKPERVEIQSHYTMSPNWSRMRSWPLYLLGLTLFAIEYVLNLQYPNSYFVEIISLFGLLFVTLGLLLSFLKFMSR